ncbi:MAG: transglycosylase domain-containing protein [Cyclobacteriaceae bacterium]
MWVRDMQELIRKIKRRIQRLRFRHLRRIQVADFKGLKTPAFREIMPSSYVSRMLLKIRTIYSRLNIYFLRHRKVKYAVNSFSVISLLLLGFFVFILTQTPSPRELSTIKNAVASEVYSADSLLLGRYFIQDRTEIKFEDISPDLIAALIATEDIRFYGHNGIDYRSLVRVFVKTILLQDESSGGGSTITQQLAKNLFPRKSYWMASMLINKFREAIIALRMEGIYTKEDILALYLNTIPFADNTYGIQAAAKRFFSTTSKELTLGQAGVLVGMLKATHYYNPRLFPARARDRRNIVFSQMVRYDLLAKGTADSLKKKPVELQYQNTTFHEGLAPYFREHVKAELMKWCENHKKPDGTPYNLYTDGLKIYTTIDSRLQQYAEKAVSRQMADIQNVFFDHWGKVKPWQGREEIISDAIRRSRRYKALAEEGLSEEAIMEVFHTRIPMRLFTWEGEKEVEASPLDSIKHHLQYLNAGFLAMEPATGQVQAWVGGINHDFFQYDHVRETTKRQVGSIFKPFVFAMAIEKGIQPCELFSAEKQTYINEEGEPWTPRNSQYDYDVNYTMRGALAYSVNTISVKLIQRAGIENTIRLARRLGIRSELPVDASISLGSASISMMEMAGAYSALANNGKSVYPYFIQSIQDRRGKVYRNFKPKSSDEPALSAETAQLVRHMLQGVVQEGTASRLRWRYHILNDVAGKTGTTQDNADGWFMAVTPGLVIASWVGADDPRIRFRSTYLGQGSNTALPMAAYFLEQVNKDEGYSEISNATFEPLPYQLKRRLNCDLYELDDSLLKNIEKTVWQRDSIIQADTLSAPPPETFLQMLYRRKIRIMLASQPQENDQSSGETTTTTVRQ